MRLRDDEEVSESLDVDNPHRDLMGWVTPYIIRILCENPFDGGRGLTPNQVGELTLDQIYFLVCDKKMLRNHKKSRIIPMDSTDAAVLSKGGLVSGVAADGTKFKAVVGGESLAKRLLREAEERKKQTPREVRKQKRADRIAKRNAAMGLKDGN